jgi:hypothetical protein
MPEEITIADEIVARLDRKPFQPFIIVMNIGERYEVTGRFQVAVMQSLIILLRPNLTSVYVRTNQISSLEVLEPV